MYVHINVGAHVCLHVYGGQRLISNVFLYSCLPCILRKSFSHEPRVYWLYEPRPASSGGFLCCHVLNYLWNLFPTNTVTSHTYFGIRTIIHLPPLFLPSLPLSCCSFLSLFGIKPWASYMLDQFLPLTYICSPRCGYLFYLSITF